MLWKKIFKKSFILAFTFYAVDVRKTKKRSQFSFAHSISYEMELEETKKKEQRKTRLYNNRKWQKRREYHERKMKYASTKSRDHRYLNQKSLRRMYRNV